MQIYDGANRWWIDDGIWWLDVSIDNDGVNRRWWCGSTIWCESTMVPIDGANRRWFDDGWIDDDDGIWWWVWLIRIQQSISATTIMKTASLGLLEVPVVCVNAGGGCPPGPPLCWWRHGPFPLLLFSSRTVFWWMSGKIFLAGWPLRYNYKKPHQTNGGLSSTCKH